VHIEAAHMVGKPLLLGEYNKLPPISQRTAFVQMVLSTLDGAFKAGEPVAGMQSKPVSGMNDSLAIISATHRHFLPQAQKKQYLGGYLDDVNQSHCMRDNSAARNRGE